MSSKQGGTNSSASQTNSTVERLKAITKQYERKLAAQTMAELPSLDQLIDDVIKAQRDYIVELEARIEELEAECGGQAHRSGDDSPAQGE